MDPLDSGNVHLTIPGPIVHTSPDRIAKGLYWQQSLGVVSGCTPASPGCQNCWAVRLHHRQEPQSELLFRSNSGGVVWNGQVRFNREALERPFKRKVPTTYAVWNDLFHPGIHDDDIRLAMGMMVANLQHTFIVLTKRPQRLHAFAMAHPTISPTVPTGFLPLEAVPWPPPNVILGTSIENHQQAWRQAYLADTPAAARVLSFEPLLGPIYPVLQIGPRPDWVIIGSESGDRRRPCEPEWAASLVSAFHAAEVPIFLKQLPGQDGQLIKAPQFNGRQWLEVPGPENGTPVNLAPQQDKP